MKILGIEWSSSVRSIAIGHWSSVLGMKVLGTARLPDGRQARYMETLESLTAECAMRKQEIKAIAVGIGPGSYAGIRSSIAVAYGWHLANDARLIGISSARVLARQALSTEMCQRVHTLIDAQRGECYHGLFEKQKDGLVHEVKPLSILHPDEIPISEDHHACYAGERLERWCSEMQVKKIKFIEIQPKADALMTEAVPYLNQPGAHSLEPIYLRPASFLKAPPSQLPKDLNIEALVNPSES